MKVVNKNIVITGGGNGVGRELVLNLLSKGATVIAVDINQAGLQETFRISGDNERLLTRIVDITDKEAVASFAEDIISKLGHVDGVINNAGIIQPFIQLKDLKLEQIDKVMSVNFYGTLYMTKVFLNHLLTRPEGHIVNIASMGGFLPVPGQSSYGSSKAAVKLMTEGLYSELLDTNVHVTLVFPGAMATDIKKNSKLTDKGVTEEEKNSKMLLKPDTAAELIIKGMEKNKYSFCIGKDAKAMNFLYSMNPGFATRLIKRVMGSKEH
ncbi:SDR family NAD(P)-dependent oxidoreductase [Clostridium folliculivorans]|uniref:Short-chain dehydrogenase n=1 Tax=Clostridium folliculivorans TaxID=2886038 RepID=A0A9W5Y4X2_9CLOT|nr:SDR family oxidoreductase [Clostridium folliculivorans]GKU26659.1 short-chain dehydrogenase [Clostridium folliculivorans]GKU28909.1 short-chain dehydrogenase [Clostridium folliculivorans]